MDLGVNAFHILITGPFLLYVGLAQPKSVTCYRILLAMAILLFVVFVREFTKPWAIVHMALLVPLLAYVGIMRNESGVAYSFLVAVGVSATGYHTIRACEKLLW